LSEKIIVCEKCRLATQKKNNKKKKRRKTKMSAQTFRCENEKCGRAINEEFKAKLIDLVVADEALRVVERMLNYTDAQISFERALQLLVLAEQHGIR
jgi:hypothetical protein